MSLRTLTPLLLALAGASVAGPASAFELTGSAGVGYDRIETWSGAESDVSPRLQFDGSLGARGSFFGRGVLDWNGNVAYDGRRDTYATSETTSDALTYSGSLSLLDTNESKLSLSGTASRGRAEFDLQSAATPTTGSTLVELYSVHGRGGDGVRPPLRGGVSYSDVVNRGFGRPETTRTTTEFDVGTHLGIPSAYDLDVDYRFRTEEGSEDPLNYTSQTVSMNAALSPGRDVGGFLHADYFLREPELEAPTNLELEDTRVSAGLDWGDERKRGRALYTYSNSFVSALAVEERQRIQQTLSAIYERRLGSEWQAVGSVTGALNEDRAGDAETTATGESVGATIRWRRHTERNRDLAADLGARVGLLDPASGESRLAYGVASTVMFGSSAGSRYNVSYGIAFDKNLDAAVGWALKQHAHGELNKSFSRHLHAQATLNLEATRVESAFGASASRSASASGVLAGERKRLTLQLGVTDGLSGALKSPFTDGLIIPAGYDTHSRFAEVSAEVRLFTRLGFLASARYNVLSGPEFRDQQEARVRAAAEYGFGEWSFTVEDRYIAGGAASFSEHRVNELYVRASRTFGMSR